MEWKNPFVSYWTKIRSYKWHCFHNRFEVLRFSIDTTVLALVKMRINKLGCNVFKSLRVHLHLSRHRSLSTVQPEYAFEMASSSVRFGRGATKEIGITILFLYDWSVHLYDEQVMIYFPWAYRRISASLLMKTLSTYNPWRLLSIR